MGVPSEVEKRTNVSDVVGSLGQLLESDVMFPSAVRP